VPEGAIEVYALWLDEPAEDEDEEQVVEPATLCGEGKSVLRMRRAIDSDLVYLELTVTFTARTV
jgi:hypothetical protein